jgi:hypothetical protein
MKQKAVDLSHNFRSLASRFGRVLAELTFITIVPSHYKNSKQLLTTTSDGKCRLKDSNVKAI